MPWEVIYSIFLIDYDRRTKSLHFGDGHPVDKVWTLCSLHRKPSPFSPSLPRPCKLRKYPYVFFSFSRYVHWYSTRQGLPFIPEYHGRFSNKYHTKKTSLTYSSLLSSFSWRFMKYGPNIISCVEVARQWKENPPFRANPRRPKCQCLFQSITQEC